MRTRTFLTPVVITSTNRDRAMALLPRVLRLIEGEDIGGELYHDDCDQAIIDGIGAVWVDTFNWGPGAEEHGDPELRSLRKMEMHGIGHARRSWPPNISKN